MAVVDSDAYQGAEAPLVPANDNSNKNISDFKAIEGGNQPLSPAPDSRQRRRTVKKALALLEGADIPPGEKRRMAVAVRAAKQPSREAHKHLDRWMQRAVPPQGGEVDLSDVEELRVLLVRRDRGIWEPQRGMLHALELRILEGNVTRREFKRVAGLILGLEQVLRPDFRKAEAMYLLEWEEKRGDGGGTERNLR